jgi:hypothetical protein
VLAWIEAGLARKEDFVGRSLAGRPLVGSTPELSCRDHELGWCPRGTTG